MSGCGQLQREVTRHQASILMWTHLHWYTHTHIQLLVVAVVTSCGTPNPHQIGKSLFFIVPSHHPRGSRNSWRLFGYSHRILSTIQLSKPMHADRFVFTVGVLQLIVYQLIGVTLQNISGTKTEKRHFCCLWVSVGPILVVSRFFWYLVPRETLLHVVVKPTSMTTHMTRHLLQLH